MTEEDEAKRILRWARRRRCLRCSAVAPLHVFQRIEGSRGPRLALIRSTNGRLHEFDPGERRISARA